MSYQIIDFQDETVIDYDGNHLTIRMTDSDFKEVARFDNERLRLAISVDMVGFWDKLSVAKINCPDESLKLELMNAIKSIMSIEREVSL